jgi:ubiquinone/menaquinone biosynthesis C-methylase UbiE
MPDSDLSQQMRADWNERAIEDAYYYVAFGRKGQDDDEFFATAADVVRALEAELKRFPPGDRRARRALEIGCGPGRLMRPMSWNFGEVHGVDVSDEMIRLAKEKLVNVPNAFPRTTNGTNLADYRNDFFDFVYSYAVFQHIPSRDVVFSYLAEARRVLKPGGLVHCQVNGLPPTAKQYTTWEGVRISAEEMAEFASAHDFQLLAVEGVDTQYMWITMRKQPSGWFRALSAAPPPTAARIRKIVNSYSGEPIVPASGRFACMSIWIENLPAECDLNQINIEVEGRQAAPIYIGSPVFDGVSQVNALLPPDARTGLVPVDVLWFGEPLCERAWARIAPPGPAVPRLTALSDGINLLSGAKIMSRSVKLFFEELAAPEQLEVSVDGLPIPDLDLFCTDPIKMRFEINFTLPEEAEKGAHTVQMRLGPRVFPAVGIEVV